MTEPRTARVSRIAAPLALCALLAALLTSCSNQPAVCDQADQLKATVEHLKYTNVSENGLTALTTNLQAVRTEAAKLRGEAASQFQTEVQAVQTAADQLQGRIATARVEPSAAAFGDVGAALGQLRTALTNLQASVSKTC